MKTLNAIRYVLFGLIVLGCFANFAQNDYGLTIIYFAEFCIGTTMFVEAFMQLAESRGQKRRFLFLEHLFLGFVFCAFAFSRNPSPLPRMTIMISLVSLLFIYLIRGIRDLITETKKGVFLSICVFLLTIGTLISVIGFSFKIEHWYGGNFLMRISFGIALFFVILLLARKKFRYEDELISIRERFRRLPGKRAMIFVYFSVWITYITLTMYHLAPNFYTLSNPPAEERLKTIDPNRSDTYWNNYDNFFENRRRAADN